MKQIINTKAKAKGHAVSVRREKSGLGPSLVHAFKNKRRLIV